MRTRRQTALVCAGWIVLLGIPEIAASQTRIAGIIENISGPAYWRKNSRAKETIKLDDKLDQARILHVGEQVRTDPNGRLRLILCSTKENIDGPSEWFTLSVSHECPNQTAFEEYGRVGGVDRGKPSQIFSPADHSVIQPDRFAIKWVPSTAQCIVSFSIYEPDSVKVWSKDDVDGSTGLLESEESKSALKKYRAKSGQGPLALRLTDSCANDLFVTFSLISVESEASLKEEMEHWDDQDELLLTHLGRAFVFARYRMFPQVADEYEACLKSAPNSRDLLIRAILAHRSTGNQARELELSKRLPLGTAIP